MASRILVVDDEKFIVEAITQHLTQLGYEVLPYQNPVEALEFIKNEQVDLVLTDLRMPDVSGMDITRAVHDRSGDTRVIILTGYATLDSAIESVHLQVYSYLHKPFDLRQLGQVVERAITEQQLERENMDLYAKIGNMLHDITTLHQVSRLIYDTDDWDMALEFALDTLSIGLGLKYSCLACKDDSGEYQVVKVNVPEGSKLGEKFAKANWSDLETIVPAPDGFRLESDNSGAKFLKQISGKNERVDLIYVAPIWYRENLLGYLTVCQIEGGKKISEDHELLLNILATQMSPQVYQSSSSGDSAASKGILVRSRDILRDRIAFAKANGQSRLAVALMRIKPSRPWLNEEALESFQKEINGLLSHHHKDAELHWLGEDTVMVLFPNTTQVQADVMCLAINSDFVKSENEKMAGSDEAANPQLLFASAAWPGDAQAASQLLNITWFRLMSEIQRESIRTTSVSAEDA